eukprot:6280682-Lingulodinium_polyedra.AAC.1
MARPKPLGIQHARLPILAERPDADLISPGIAHHANNLCRSKGLIPNPAVGVGVPSVPRTDWSHGT